MAWRQYLNRSSQNFAGVEPAIPEVTGSRFSVLPSKDTAPVPSRDTAPPDPVSKIVLRANSQKPAVTPPTSIPAANDSAASTDVMSPNKRSSAAIGGMPTNLRTTVPWLQELNDKQKRKSQLIDINVDIVPPSPTSPPTSAKPIFGTAKPTQPEPLSAKSGGKQNSVQQLPETSLCAKPQQVHKQPLLRTSDSFNRPKRNQEYKHGLDEPDVVSSAASSRKSSASSEVTKASGLLTKRQDSSPHVEPVAPANITDTVSHAKSEPHKLEDAVCDRVDASVVMQATISSFFSTTNNTQSSENTSHAPSANAFPAPAHHQRRESSPTPKSVSASSSISSHRSSSQHSPQVSRSHINNQHSALAHPPSSASITDPTESSRKKSADQIGMPDSRIPKDLIEDAKALDKVNAILDKLLPKVSALEDRLEEQKRDHARQLQLLTDELDDERKKRACLEIEMERLKKMLLTYTAHV